MSSGLVAVVPSDVTPLPSACWMLYVGVAGDLALVGAGDAPAAAVVFKAVVKGWWRCPVQISQVMATGTTATNIVASLNGDMQSAVGQA